MAEKIISLWSCPYSDFIISYLKPHKLNLCTPIIDLKKKIKKGDFSLHAFSILVLILSRPSARFPQHRRKKRKEMDEGIPESNQHKQSKLSANTENNSEQNLSIWAFLSPNYWQAFTLLYLYKFKPFLRLAIFCLSPFNRFLHH